MNNPENAFIELQKKQVFEQVAHVDLVQACTPVCGILKLEEEEKELLMSFASRLDGKKMFFIPASGSGSRMLSLLHVYLNSGELTDELKRFFGELSELALYDTLPESIQEAWKKDDFKAVAEFVVSTEKVSFGNKPKGLIPFHKYPNGALTPFQEHVIQSKELFDEDVSLHFTIQESYKEDILTHIQELEYVKTGKVNVSFSSQDPQTDAYCFDETGELVIEEGSLLRRPAGHGALLKNLEAIDADVLFIKNIDNVQHQNKNTSGLKSWKLLQGVLVDFQNKMRDVAENFSVEKVAEINAKYHFLSEEALVDLTEEEFQKYMSRPTKICGMVKNEGAPGGGPFWIRQNGSVTSQIVEKIQISPVEEQQKVVGESTHFNPVFIVALKNDLNGNRLDLNDYVDHDAFLAVDKTHNGQKIRYRELPGLWNGSMSDWNTIFVEIPSETFSPVKSIVDLLVETHKA